MNEKIAFLRGYDGPPLKIMEVCGTHTAAIMKSGIRSFLPPGIRLVSGPGCPVCVTPTSYIDACLRVAGTPGGGAQACLASFGDMLKVPGSAGTTLSDALGAGANVRMVYAPFDVLPLAEENPGTEYVVAAVGFETTAPAYALLMEEADERGLSNIRLLPALKSALSAIDYICAIGEDVDAFLCPGHVSVITGSRAYEPLAEKYGKPFVVAGFEARHILEAVHRCAIDALAIRNEGRPGAVTNLYPEAVSEEGNPKALALIEQWFEKEDTPWRGLGTIPASGYALKQERRRFSFGAVGNASGEPPSGSHDPQDLTDLQASQDSLPPGCRCGEVILGRIDPDACPLFGASCTPAHAVGPCMVSSEGACGIWFKHSR
ncbi:MAG: hydrogenase formation protein HypD [Clostridiales Family XIII bacterium]|nr:hydrogenase formation protein HypD [Clostridiales Family XIII bacterium]